MTFLLKLVQLDKLVAYVVNIFTALSTTQWKTIVDLATQAAATFPADKQLRLPWVKAQLSALAKQNGWNISDGDINFSVELAVKLLKALKVIPQ